MIFNNNPEVTPSKMESVVNVSGDKELAPIQPEVEKTDKSSMSKKKKNCETSENQEPSEVITDDISNTVSNESLTLQYKTDSVKKNKLKDIFRKKETSKQPNEATMHTIESDESSMTVDEVDKSEHIPVDPLSEVQLVTKNKKKPFNIFNKKKEKDAEIRNTDDPKNGDLEDQVCEELDIIVKSDTAIVKSSSKYRNIFKKKESIKTHDEIEDAENRDTDDKNTEDLEDQVCEELDLIVKTGTATDKSSSKFKNIFRKKESKKTEEELSNPSCEASLNCEDEESPVLRDGITDDTTATEKSISKKGKLKNMFKKKSQESKEENNDVEVVQQLSEEPFQQESIEELLTEEIEADPNENEMDNHPVNKKGKFKNIFKKKDSIKEDASNDIQTIVETLREPNEDGLKVIEQTDDVITTKKNKFSIFSSKKKHEPTESTNSDNKDRDIVNDDKPEVVASEELPNEFKVDENTLIKKDKKHKGMFSKKTKSEESPLLNDDSLNAEEHYTEETADSDIKLERKKEKFKHIFKLKKKHDTLVEEINVTGEEYGENYNSIDPQNRDKIPDKLPENNEADSESILSQVSDAESKLVESVKEDIPIASDMQVPEKVIKKDKFMNIFQKKKVGSETKLEEHKEEREEPSDLKLEKGKSFLRRSFRKKKDKSSGSSTKNLENFEDFGNKIKASQSNEELTTTHENPAVVSLKISMELGKAPYKGSTYSLDDLPLKNDNLDDSYMGHPAVALLANPTEINSSEQQEDQENHLEDRSLNESNHCLNDIKTHGSSKEDGKVTESVAPAERSKSKNIFKRKKKPQALDPPLPSDPVENDNDEYLAIAPISMTSIEKPAKSTKTWSERMKLQVKKMEPTSKEAPRNEDNELDVSEDRLKLDDAQSAVKLFNETIEPTINSDIPIEEQMQLLCDLFGHESDVIWDSYTLSQKEALKNKLKLVLDPGTQNSKKKNIEKYINEMTETIWNQCKYTDGVLNMGIIFVALLNEKELDVRKSKRFSLRPVFRTVKCYDKNTKTTKGCCMVFIDETGRVYTNWQHFMAENTYDPSIIVAPKNGIFNTDDKGKVCLEFFTAPSSSVGAKILSITDKTATVTGLGASACFIGGMLTVALLPVAAPAIGIAMAGAGLVGAASAGYSMVRSTQKMKDLSEHEKSLNIKDAEARGHWLSLIGSMTGFVSGVASHGIDLLARSGHHIPAIFRGSIDAINAASIAVNGVGVIDGFSTVFLKWNEEKISTLEIMQLSASLFMFTHSMYNFETANSIIKKHQDLTVNEFRDKLGQTQRHHYHKMAQASLKVHGKGHHDVIRSLRAIPNQSDFQKMHKADNVITEGMVTAATLLVAKFCKKYFVVDENDLTNTILNAMALLSDHAFDVFVDVVERFVECKGEIVQKSLRGMISVEEVMSDILSSVTSISESLGLDASEFIETLTKTDNFLCALIERIYDLYKDYERVEPNQTCAECKGVFTVKSVL